MRVRQATITDAAGIARVHTDAWRAAYDGIVPGRLLSKLRTNQMSDRWELNIGMYDGNSIFVLEGESGGIVGFMAAGEIREALEGYDSEIYALYVAETHQQQGGGERLLHRVAEDLIQRGFGALMVWTLAENDQSGAFFGHMGAQIVGRRTITIGRDLEEIAYGWPDLADIGAGNDMM